MYRKINYSDHLEKKVGEKLSKKNNVLRLGEVVDFEKLSLKFITNVK